MAKRVFEIKVGLFFIIPIVLMIVFVVLKLGYSLSSDTIDVYLKIDNIKMIKDGTAVKVKGYDIGRVVSIEPVYQPELHFLATLRISDQIFLNEDCVAVIQNQNVIGDAIIELRNPVKKGKPLKAGDVVEGIEYVSIEALLGDVHKLLVSVTDTVNIIKDISSDSKQDIRKFLGELSASSSTLSSILDDSQADVVKTMGTLRQTSETIKEISDELKKRPLKFLLKE